MAFEPQLVLQGAQVVGYGLRRDAQLRTDGVVVEATCRQVPHLPFAGQQVVLQQRPGVHLLAVSEPLQLRAQAGQDRKSTRLNSSHVAISYAVFCLKKKTTADA